MFDLSVKYLHNEETRKYSLDVSENVYNLKDKISNDLSISIELITLKKNDDELSDNIVLSSLDYSNVQFIVVIKDLVSISIKTNLEMFDSVNNYSTFILKNNKVLVLKEKLSKFLTISTDIISLKYEECVLDNSKSFIDYNINEKSQLIFGLNLFLLEPDNNSDNFKFKILNKFIDRNISVMELIENYSNENKLNKDLIKFNYENSVLSNESVVDLIKSSVNPVFRVITAAKIIFESNDKNIIETFLFHNETILKLRERIKSKIDSFEGNEILLYEDNLLDDSQMLGFYGENNKCFHVFSGFQLLVRCDDISIMSPIFVHNKMSIKNTKLHFAEKLHIEWLFINLLIGNDKLEDSKTIKFYGITEIICIDLKIGIDIIIFCSDEVIEYLVKPDTTFQDIKQCISYKCRIDLENIKFLINDEEVKSEDNLAEIAKLNRDLIIFVKPKLSISILHENGSKVFYQIWDKSRISHLKELISANTRILKESIALQIGSEELDDAKTIDFYKINENSEIRMIIQNRVTILDEQQEIHCLIIEPTDSILSLKQLLSLKFKKSLSEIHIYLNQIYLEDCQTIHYYNIDFNSLLEMKLGIRIRLVDEDNSKYEVVLDKISTINMLKDLLYSNYKLEMNHFNLIFGDLELTDDLSIGSLDFNNDSIIKIVTKSDLISIYVCNLTNEFKDFSIISVVVKSNSTIKTIKEQILANRYNVDLNEFTLAFVGENLDDQSYFYKFGIVKNNSLMLKSKTQSCCAVTPMGVVINVKQVLKENEGEPKIFKYLLDDYQSISILKQKLRDELNVSADRIKLIFAGIELNNNDTIRSLELDDNSTIMMVVKNQEEKLENKNSVKVNMKFSFLQETTENCKEEEIDQTELVGNLKQQISNELNIPSNSFVLMFNEEVMVDKNYLSIYELVDGSEIVVCNSVFVKSFTGQSMDTATVRRVPIKLTDTVDALQKRIARKLNIQSNFVKLNFQGEYLNEETLIRNTEIENESFLMMITTLKGG